MATKSLAVLCQWCYICYSGDKECLDRGSNDFCESKVTTVKEGHCNLCKEKRFPASRRKKYEKSKE